MHSTQNMPSKQAEPPHGEAIAEGTIRSEDCTESVLWTQETPQLRAGKTSYQSLSRSADQVESKRNPWRLIEEEG